MLSVRSAIARQNDNRPKTMDYSVDRRLSMIVTLLTVLTIVDLRSAHARQCYVCGIGQTDPLYDTMLMAQHGASGIRNATATGGGGGADAAAAGADRPQPADCTLFERTDANLDAYVIECPAGYMGCFTQSDGVTIVRTCNRYSINDCKTANRITYCYCNSDRCNGRDQPATQTQSAATNGAATASTTKRQQPFFRDRSFDDEDDDAEGDDEGDDDGDGGTFEASGHSDLDARVETSWSTDDTSTTASTLSSTLSAVNANLSVPATTTTTSKPSHNHRSRVGSGSVRHIKPFGSSIVQFIPVCLTAALVFGFGV